jgi:LDH2 family malate/lactate/ureidoglycolate dehydrogenase
VTAGSGSAAQPRALHTAGLHSWIAKCFASTGMSVADSGILADSLIFAEQRGVASHGLSRIPIYVARLQAGGLNPRPDVSMQQSGAVTVVDGDSGVGAVVVLRSAELAADAARVHGIALVAVRSIGHAGALGFYVDRLAAQGLVGLVFGNADPIMVPPRGGRAVLGSNPLAIAVPPSDAHTAPMLDMATTAVAHGKIVMAAARGEQIPDSWAVDAHGAATSDPTAALGGALLPAAGAKGFGLSFLIDVLTAGLSGGRTGGDIAPLYEHPGRSQGASLIIVAIDPQHCAGADELTRATQQVADAVRASGPEHGEVPMIPGEPESRSAIANADQLLVPQVVLDQLKLAYPDGADSLPLVAPRLEAGLEAAGPDPARRP